MISVCSYSELFKLQGNAGCWLLLLLQLSVARDLALFAGMCRGGVQGYCRLLTITAQLQVSPIKRKLLQAAAAVELV